MDTVTLSRIQFALTIMFHYIFPPLTIGLGVVLVYLDGMAWRTGNAASSPRTLRIMPTVAAIGMPFVLGYTAIIHSTCRGKVRIDDHRC